MSPPKRERDLAALAAKWRVDASPVQATTMDLVAGPRQGSIGPVAATKY
jgi:hypothetical protein